MTQKFLQRFGVVALFVLVAGSIAALIVVRDRMDITVADEASASRRGPDPVELLAADVAVVRDDVRGLGEGFRSGMQSLHDALEGSAGERETRLAAEVAALRSELAIVRNRLDQNAAEAAGSRAQVNQALATLGQGLQDLAKAVAEDSRQAVSVAPIVLAPAAAPSVEVAAAEVPVPAVPAATTAPESAPKKGFLSFQLPSQGFVFDQRQRFAIVSNLSRVGFDAKSTLHDFSGVTTRVEGEITANLAKPGENCSGSVSAQSASLDTGLEARDESMREILEPAKFPEVRFDWSAFEPTSVDAAAQKVVGVAKGKLSIHGVARDVSMPVTITVDASKRLAIDGQTKIKMSDFGVKPPSKLGLISVEDEAVLWIALRARTLGPAADAKR
ncbi:MAG: YceI family protein [Planctomycetota bacterium]|nr:YceI family protein [Planctomycetota bacterium]